jgi:hypothetical protein
VSNCTRLDGQRSGWPEREVADIEARYTPDCPGGPASDECPQMPQLSLPASPRTVPAARAATGVPWMFMLLLGAWLLDFQSEGEGQGIAIQAYFAAAYGFALVMLLIGDRAAGVRIQGLGALLACGAIFLGVGIGSGLIAGQQAYPVLRNSFTVAIYLSSAYITARLVVTTDPARLRFVLGLFCLLYSGSAYLIFNATSGGVDLERVRFQIVGTSATAALGYVVLAALFKLTRIEMAATALNGVIVLLSVTRTYLLVLVAQGAIFLGQIRKVFSPRLIATGVLGLVALAMVMTYGQRQVQRWEDRIVGSTGTESSEYQTLYTRLSEWQFMWNEWTSSTDHFLFGGGIAARTTYFKPREMGTGAEYMIGFGHNQHISMLFTAGTLGGLPLLILQWLHAIAAWRFLRHAIRMPHLRNDAVFLGAWGATIVLGYLMLNIFAAAFMVRGMSLWFGIGTGLLLGAQALFDPANAPRKAPPAAPGSSRYLPA